MIKAKELREMKKQEYGEESVELYVALSLIMVVIIQSAKDDRSYHRIEGEEYFYGDTTESSYVLSTLEDLGYTVDRCVEWDAWGEPIFSVIITWEKHNG